jgi:multicomponent Na+:H+ antiporter subunit E
MSNYGRRHAFTMVPKDAMPAASGNEIRRAVIARAVGFLILWLALAGPALADLPAGAIAAAAATWASFRLLPPGTWRFRPAALARFALRFFVQSVIAGVDVARRALDPRLPLRTGFVSYSPRLPPGPAQSAFCTLTSLLPGTVPCGTDDSGALVIHCLDVDQFVASQLAKEEALFVHACGGDRGND